MSFRVEATPNNYIDYDVYSSDRFTQLGRSFLSLINSNYGTKPSNENTTTQNETETIPQNKVQRPSDLCQPLQQQKPYYLIDQNVLRQIEENFLPNQSIYPYTESKRPNGNDNEEITTSLNDWQTTKQSNDSARYIQSQIITIVKCRSALASNSFSPSTPRESRNAVRLFINAHYQQQQQMDTFLDLVNEALILEPDTIKTLWDAKGEQVKHPMDVLRQGRLYFASRDDTITLDDLYISDSDLASINRFEIVRSQLSQRAFLIEKPTTTEQINVPSRKSTPFDPNDRRSAAVRTQAIIYNDPQTFPEVFLRHYTVGEVIGDGRFSAVYECQDKTTGIQLALKIIDKTRCKGFEYLIENELSILRRVKHPNIIKLVEEFESDLKYFLVFEYVSNGDLLTSVTTMNKYSEHDVALMLSQIGAALKYLHSLQIIHRDVKLENILITNYPDQSITLKLADFGLALCLTDRAPIIAAHGDSLCGTPMYIAPEVIQNRDYRIENDMWSLGIIAFTLLSGMAPFDGEIEDEILSNVLNKSIDFGLLPKVSAECRELLFLLLERDPVKRISANDLLQHPWIKRELIRRMEPVSDARSPRRRKKGTTKVQPLLTFSSVEHPHGLQASNIGSLMNDIDQL